jgi:hypothetical protein
MARRSLAALAALAALALAPAAARAQSVPEASSVKTFVTVDSVEVHNVAIVIRGVLQGESTVSAFAVYPYYAYNDQAPAAELVASCQRAAFLVMAKPGQYVLEIYSYNASSFCRVKRAVQ